MSHQAKTLFQLQTELVDTKVEVAVSRAITPVLEQIASLRHDLKHEMHREIGGLKDKMNDMQKEMGTRLSSVETALGMRRDKQTQVRVRFIDYSFRAGWLILFAAASALFSYLVVHWPDIF